MLFEVVGFIDVDQQTPLEVTVALPSEVILPPDTADDEVIDDIEDVVNTGNPIEEVVKVTSEP